MIKLVKGDHLQIRLEGFGDEWCPAEVRFASDTDPQAIMLTIRGMVRATHGFIGNILPLTIDYQRETAVSHFGDHYEILV
jgi:hypothetical protein